MSDVTYNFRISQPACVQAMEAYQKMEEQMETDKEDIEAGIELTEGHWDGLTQDITKYWSLHFFDTGLFYETLEKVKDMRGCFEDALPQINEQLARCEGFIDQLQSDSYVEPIKPAADDNTERNGGILAIDYDYIAKITETCDAILEKNTTLTGALTDIINDCSSLLDGTDGDLEDLTAASDMLNRIGNYRDALSIFKAGVQDLNVDMMIRFKAIAGTGWLWYGEFTQEQAALAAECFTDYDDTSMVKKIAKQIFTKDAAEWTEAEIDFIARTWDDAVQNGKLDVIEMYSGEMFTEECIAIEGNTKKCKYRYKCDEQKVDLIMDHLDSKEQGTAYYTLNRLKSIQTNEKIVNYKALSEIRGKTTFNISVISVDDTIRIKIETSEKLSTFCAEEKSEISLTLCDMNDVIGVDQERALRELGYEVNDIENVRLSIISDTDIEFAKQFYSLDYDGAFKENPEYISSKMLESVGKFLLNLEDMKPEDKGTRGRHVEELETIINTLLYADSDHFPMQFTYYNDTYIDKITDILYGLSERAVVELKLGFMMGLSDAELAELALEGREYYNQYSLWESVRHVYNLDIGYEQLDLFMISQRDGDTHIRITNLTGGIGSTDDKNGAGCYSFEMRIMNEDYHSEYGEDSFLIILNNPTQHGLLNKEIEDRIEELKKERKKIRAKMIAKPISYLPKVGPAVAKLFEAGDVAELISSYGQISQEIEEFHTKYEVNNWGKYTWMNTYYLMDGEIVKQKDKEQKGKVQCIGYQCAAPEIAYKMNLLENYGLEAYLEDAINKVPDDRNKEDYISAVIIAIDAAKQEQKITKDFNELFFEDPIWTIDWVDSIINDNYKENINLLSEWIY